ncbi:uncharacterized protein LOC128242318 [Mya arenaria]|uniref:uncharacterized protein LOC128242318 n=1 Tax=Mya arenaria TaxID=6604 RepID=UPI0022E3A7BD|nr:uncharacterized protein LOC128242318 [Mya arenaria]
MASYTCEECGVSFPKLSQLLQHKRAMNHWKKYQCQSCKKVFNRKDNLDRHLQKHNDENNHHCPECLKVFTREDALKEHLRQDHGGAGGVKRPSNDQGGGGEAKRKKLDEDLSAHYDIEKVSERKIEKFRSTASYYRIRVNDVEITDLPNILKYLRTLFQDIINKMTDEIASSDLVRLSLDNPELDFPIVLPFMKKSALTVDRILSEIERVLQSYEQFVVDETFGIELVHVHMPTGSGYKMKPVVDITKMLENKRSIIQIKNTDELCCARAIVTAIARHEKHPQWNSIRRGYAIQGQLAEELHWKACIPLTKCGLDEVKAFQVAVPKYQIHVLSKDHFNAIVFSGPEGGVPIYVYLHDGHFDVITTMTGFLNRNYFCTVCKKGYQHQERHTCNNPCHFCRNLHTNKEEDWKHCKTCNCKFINEDCFDLHLKKSEKGKSTCEMYHRCNNCDQLINRSKHKRDHMCGETYCKTCKDYVMEDHKCYMQPANEDDNSDNKKKPKETQYIFFDFECTQDTIVQCNDGYLPGEDRCINCAKSWCGSMEHTPNLCVAHKVCSLCISKEIQPDSECLKCGPNIKVFSGPDTTKLFCQWLFSEPNFGTTVICHNFKGYDSYPILQYLHDNAILPDVITTGSKYMSITVSKCKIRFIDSINFIPMALADMPGAFGETELAKGYFPHLFNRRENQNVVLDHLPDMKYYCPDGMKPEKRRKFLTWYKQHEHDTFDFQKDLLRYCQSDVDILRKCCLTFRTLFMKLTTRDHNRGIDPFEKCITIASACNLVYRTLFLAPETIGIIPAHGYRPEEKQSVMAYQWLSYIANEKVIFIQHGRNIGEKSIGPYKVDGYYEDDGRRHVLEFHGCFWHGCPKCYSQSTVNPVSEMSMGDLYTRTMEKKQFIEAEGYSYTALWECEFKQQLQVNDTMKKFLDNLEIVTPLEPRDAFYGGRTEAFKLYEKATADKQIKYYDVTSLYPYINKTGKIPLGHPEIITDNFQNISNYEGLIKCKVLPPRNLHIPVLPMKCNGKLMFSLCRLCTETYQQEKCTHSDTERTFTGTWVTDEIKEAVSQGYIIQNIYEIWHFDEISQYDSVSKSGGIFTDYVNTFLKVKQEASGWPKWCVTEQDKQRYIKEYYEKEGILLDYDKIKKNPGLRSLAKLMLNSFWGKFGQRTNLTQTTLTDDPAIFTDMMTSDQQKVQNVRFINDNRVQIDWVYNTDFVEASCRTNTVIAAYTTAQARLKLYSYLKPLDTRLAYCDTDSLVFTTRPGEWEPPLGDYLGDLTDEVPGNSITDFVTGGPKNYAYRLNCADDAGQTSICKVRGITLNFKNTLDINFETVQKMVTCGDKVNPITVVDTNKIVRSPENCCIITKTEYKDYKIVFDKRVIGNAYTTSPYGY